MCFAMSFICNPLAKKKWNIPPFLMFDYKHLNNNIMAPIYDFKAVAGNGKEIDFRQFEGKVLFIVNTASKCGFKTSLGRRTI